MSRRADKVAARMDSDGTNFILPAPLKVPVEAYDASGWNGSSKVPTQDAVRDIVENFVTNRSIVIAVVAPGTDLTIGDKKFIFPVPISLDGAVIESVRLKVETAGITNVSEFDIDRRRGGSAVSIFTTLPTIDSNKTSTDDSATPYVIDTSNDDLQSDDDLIININSLSTTVPKGLTVEINIAL